MFATVWDILVNYQAAFLGGLAVTLQITGIVWALGLTLGAALGYAGWRWPETIGLGLRAVSFFLGGVPVLVFLFWLHYPVQSLFDVVIDPYYTATFTFTILNIVAVADLVRAGCQDFPQQYLLAARVCGLTPVQAAWHIQLPILFRQVLPGLLMLQITMLHVSLFASLISVEEIFRVAQRINATIYKPVEIYTALAVFFLAVCLPVNGVALTLRTRFTRDLSER